MFAETCVFGKQSPGPILCGLLAQALLLPKLRRQLAEFLDRASLVHLRMLSSSTCVGLRYGLKTDSRARLFLAARLGSVGLPEGSLPYHPSELRPNGFSYPVLLQASTTISNRWLTFHLCVPPHDSLSPVSKCRNILPAFHRLRLSASA